ncbi:MAG: serine/threonine-protein kinase [Myxococcota bacterium]
MTEHVVLTDARDRRFTLTGTLGRGGFGDVYLATMHTPGGLDQQVALKLLTRGLDPDRQSVKRLRDEAYLLTRLRHPVVLAAHDLAEIDGRVALVTEYIEGEDLSACLRGASRLPRSALVEVIEQVAHALDAVWSELQVVHRDIKPQNIRIGVHGTVKLLDFGIARSDLMNRHAKTSTEVVVGTLAFLAPERFDADLPLGPASDVFALGCVFFEGFTGTRFFHQMDYPRMLKLAIDRQAFAAYYRKRIQALRPGPVADLIATMLSHDPALRPTAAEVATTCEALVAQWSDGVTLRRWCKERNWPRPGPPPTPAALRESIHEESSTPFDDSGASDLPARTGRAWGRQGMVAAILGLVGVGLAGVSLLLLGLGIAWRQLERWSPAAEATAVTLEAPPPTVPDPVPAPVPTPKPSPTPRKKVDLPKQREASPPVPPKPASPTAREGPDPEPAIAVEARLYPVHITSTPVGARFQIRGRPGSFTTPKTLRLPSAEYTIDLTAPTGNRTSIQTLKVSRQLADATFTWGISADKWTIRSR